MNTYDDLCTLIGSEIDWCKKNKNPDIVEFEGGFIKGLAQAKHLIGEAKESVENDFTKEESEARKNLQELILEKAKENKVVFSTFDGYMFTDLDEFIKQPVDGLLYDLNRLPEVVLTFIDDPKWVNDYAVYLVIKKLKELLEECRDELLAVD